MKLLTQTGLLYSAVQAQVGGHYGSFPEIDWMVQFNENISVTTATTTTATTIGLNPMIRQVETLFDGGKLITGNGAYTGTMTFGWMLKMFGVKPCGGTAIASNPSLGYSLWTIWA